VALKPVVVPGLVGCAQILGKLGPGLERCRAPQNRLQLARLLMRIDCSTEVGFMTRWGFSIRSSSGPPSDNPGSADVTILLAPQPALGRLGAELLLLWP
jgi:hypothetical protein